MDSQQVRFTQSDIDALRTEGDGYALPNFSPLAWYRGDEGWRPALIIGKTVSAKPSEQWYNLKVFPLQTDLLLGSTTAYVSNATAFDTQALIGRNPGQFIPCDLIPIVLGLDAISAPTPARATNDTSKAMKRRAPAVSSTDAMREEAMATAPRGKRSLSDHAAREAAAAVATKE